MQTWNLCSKEALLSLSINGPTLLTTINADIYGKLRKSPALMKILLSEKICIDGRPLYYILKFFNPKLELLQGSDFIYETAKHSAIHKNGILIIGGLLNVNNKAVTSLRNNYKCDVYGFSPEIVDEAALTHAANLINNYENLGFVFICLGSPKQEIFSIELKSRIKKSKKILIIGAGGVVDFAANRFKRAPKVFQFFGLEGFYRLIEEPSKKRLLRLFTSISGLILFSIDFILNKIHIEIESN